MRVRLGLRFDPLAGAPGSSEEDARRFRELIDPIVAADRVGLEIAWVSGRHSEATALRASELGVDDVIQASDGRKIPPMAALLDRKGISWDQVAFLGDDLADLPVLRRVGLPLAVANAVPEVEAAARHVTASSGGHGAVREVIEWLLRARDEWDTALARYLELRQGA